MFNNLYCTLSKCSRRQIDNFPYFSPENKLWYFLHIVSIWMKYQSLFSGKCKTNISKYRLLNFLPTCRMLSVTSYLRLYEIKSSFSHIQTAKAEIGLHFRTDWSWVSLPVDIFYSNRVGWFCKRTMNQTVRMCRLTFTFDFRTKNQDHFFMNITKTCLYDFNPLKPHFYIIKLGFTEVYITYFC